jgi:Fur family peroxide stress response transcriptional regulator
MADSEFRYQTLLSKLKQRGFRLTSQRLALIRLLAVSEAHPSAAQLYESLRVQFPTVSLATIYKTLTLLQEEGEVMKIDLSNDSRFDGNKPYPHPHLICNGCNKIVDGDFDIDLASIKSLEQSSGYQISRSQINFYGLCPDCKAKSK